MISTFYFLDEETERSNRKQGDVARREGEKTINALKVLRKIVSQMNFLRGLSHFSGFAVIEIS